MKAARVFKRNDGWYFGAVSKTTVGMGMGTPPYLKLDNDASSDALGEAALQALEGSREGVPHPTPEEAEKTPWPMLELARVKTWAAFAKRAASVRLDVDDEWLVVQPWRNEGSKMGFTAISGTEIRVPLHSPSSEIGEAVKKAIAVSESQDRP